MGEAHHIHGFLHIMGTDNHGPALNTDDSRGQTGRQSLIHFPAQQFTKQGLARNADQDWQRQRLQRGHLIHQGKIVRHGLGKAKTRIDQEPLPGNASLLTGGDALTQKIDHLGSTS